MKNKIKTLSLIAALVITFGVSTYFANESNAQGRTYAIGDKGPAGGWIFYDKGDYSDGWRYLEAAPFDQSSESMWGCYGTSIAGAKGRAIGEGKNNTHAIIRNCGAVDIAAKVCTAYRGGGKSDWFLPSRDELNLMFTQLHRAGIGNFSYEYYWSSTEEVSTYALFQNFSNGNINILGKPSKVWVRAIRAF